MRWRKIYISRFAGDEDFFLDWLAHCPDNDIAEYILHAAIENAPSVHIVLTYLDHYIEDHDQEKLVRVIVLVKSRRCSHS
jgi:hypothetical protein